MRGARHKPELSKAIPILKRAEGGVSKDDDCAAPAL
jgi:hypothetical protein